MNQQTNIHVDEGALLNAEYGPQQVESLLRFVVEPRVQKGMRDAEDDADALEHLAARKGKKKRKKRTTSY